MDVLLVEDDFRVAEFLERGLRAEGYGVTVASTGPDGLRLASTTEPAIVILDLMLPGMSGLEVCQELRAAQRNVLILILTAMDSVEDKIAGLRMGADDYLTKPFSFDELLARMEALLRRSGSSIVKPPVLRVGDLIFDRESLEVRRAGRRIELTAKELALLELFMCAPGKVFSRTKILNSVWGESSDPLTNIVDVYVRRLRAKLDDGSDRGLITTLRGFGYKIEPGDAAGERNDRG